METQQLGANPMRHLAEQAWKGGYAFARSTSQGGLDYHTRHYNGLLDKANALDARQADLLAAAVRARDALNELIGADYDVTGELAALDAAIAKVKGE